jgi:hypothetical protein
MTLIILAGVWALAFGHITLTQQMKMKGNDARVFGLVLILVAAFVLPHLNGTLGGFMPKVFARNEALKSAFEMLIAALAVHATGWTMLNIIPRFRIPTVTVSLKRQRA